MNANVRIAGVTQPSHQFDSVVEISIGTGFYMRALVVPC